MASFKQIANVCTVGKSYLVEFDWVHTGGTLYVRVGVGVAATFTTSGRKSVVLVAAGIQGFEAYGGAVSGVLDNISVREFPGAHLTQSTAANRPVLRQSGGVYSWQFDGSNDSFTSTLTTGNAGWICGGTKVQTLGSAGALFIGNGAFSATGSPGIMIYSHGAAGGRFMQLWLSNGASRQSVGSTVTPTGSAFVFDGGWDSSNAAIAINGVEQNLIKTIDVTSAQTIRIGIDPGLFWMLNGFVFATIIMPTVLPTASERATLRQFIASLSGVTM